MNNFYNVYVHIFPNKKVYVGITCRDVNRRWGTKGQGYSEQIVMKRAIEKYGWENIQHVVLHKDLTADEAKALEVHYITNVYKSNNPNYGYNLTNGGDGTSGYYPSEETKRKMSESRRGSKNPNYGKSISDEQRVMLSKYAKERTGNKNSFYGKKHTEESKKKVSETKKSQNLVGSKVHNSKPVRCIELDKIFESASLAAKWIGASPSTITNACRHGADFLSQGYHWEYVK